jgi:hypothetical protein
MGPRCLMVGQSDEPCDAAYEAHHSFLKWLRGHPINMARSELRGHNLACCCSLSEASHADIWLELANELR